jgi:3,4-dihydroxy 2-butanone 4-phosphate synthase/GTP cyclohydrolase II
MIDDIVFASIPEALAELKAGRILIVVDDEDRENEGDFVLSAETVTAESVNFMVTHGRGLVCLSAEQSRLQQLGLELMVPSPNNTSAHGTAFTISIDAVNGTTTGISAGDRAITIRKFVDATAKPHDFAKPGHIFPLAAANGGVLRRAGHTEAAVDLARLAGHASAGVICEVMNDDGTMARVPQLAEIARRFSLKMVTIKDLIQYRRRSECLVRRVEEVQMPTEFGDFLLILYESVLDQEFHIALVKGDVRTAEPVLVRVHSQCLTGDVFASARCDCGAQLEWALRKIEAEGRGAVVYMRQEGRGIGLENKLHAYSLQEIGLDTVQANQFLGFPPDIRDYGIGAQILRDMGIQRVRLMSNNPAKRAGVEGYGLDVEEMIPIMIPPNPHNERYLHTKRTKLGHILNYE